MASRPRLFIAVLLAASGACRATPHLTSPEGERRVLTCDDDEDCGDFGLGWRCRRGGCVANSPPRLPVLDATNAEVVLGGTHSAAASAVDPDGDPLTYSWSPAGELGATISGDDTPQLSVTPLELGAHIFTVTASDGFAESPPATLRVIARPTGLVRYVSRDRGVGKELCGSIDAPCASLDDALSSLTLRGAAPATVMVATTLDPEGYRSCLVLDAGVAVVGGLSPETFKPEPAGRERTRIICPRSIAAPGDADVGHIVRGGSAEDVTLTNVVEGAAPSVFFAVGVTEAPGTLTNVDVVATCNEGCGLVGLGVDRTTATLRGVELRSETLGFYPLRSFTGLLANDATVHFTATNSGAPSRRGGISMRALAEESGSGVFSYTSTLTLEGLRIEGGFGGGLFGVTAMGGFLDVRDTNITLTAYGSVALHGIVGGDCYGAGCECDDPNGCALTSPLVATLARNEIELKGGFTSTSVPSCRGIGIWFGAGQGDTSVEDNTIRVSKDFTLALGAISIAETGVSTQRWIRNTIALEGARLNAGCLEFNRSGLADRTGTSLEAGAIALGVGALNEVVIHGNSIVVGESLPLEDIAPELRTYSFVGLSLTGTTTTPVWTVTGNRVQALAGALTSTGAYLNAAPAVLINNFIDGGDAGQATAVILENSPSDELPRLEHNTLIGGGPAAVASTVIDISDGSLLGGGGTLVNNLLDAGDGSGRRVLVRANLGDLPAVLDANVAQFRGAPRILRPLVAFPTGRVEDESAWLVLLANGGGAALVQQYGNAIEEWVDSPIYQRALFASAGNVQSASDNWLIIGGAPSSVDGTVRLAITSVRTGHLTDAYFPSLVDRSGQAHVPRAAGYGAVRALGPLAWSGIVFIEGEERGPHAGLYVLRDAKPVGFAPPELVVALESPRLLALSPSGERSSVINVTSTGTVLVTYPADCAGEDFCATSVDVGGPVEGLLAARSLNVDGIDELVLTSGRSIYVFADYDPPLALPPATALAACPVGATVAVVSSVDLDASTSPSELAVGCSDGSLHVVEMGTGGVLSAPHSDDTTFSRPLVLLADHTRVAGSPVQGRLLAADDRDHVAVFAYTRTAGLTLLAEGDLIADAALRQTYAPLRRTFPLVMNGVALAASDAVCELAEATLTSYGGDVARRDVHLVSGPNACVDGGTPTTSSADIDGDGTRTDGSPDVGADEL